MFNKVEEASLPLYQRDRWAAASMFFADTKFIRYVILINDHNRFRNMKQTLTIECGDDVLLALGLSPEQFVQEVPLLTAVKLYELGRLSAGTAAALAGIPKSVFLVRLASYGVDTFQLTEHELEEELDNARCHQ